MAETLTLTLAVFFSYGAFGDCARHSILHALNDTRVGKIKVFSTSIPTLDEANWKCGCGTDHGAQLKDSPNYHKLEMVRVKTLTGPLEEVAKEVNLEGVDAVISGIGNRQIFIGDRCAKKGTKNITSLMQQNGIERLVMMSSMGVVSGLGSDAPGIEWRFEGKIMGIIFSTLSYREYNDIVGAENAANASGVNFLSVRSVGLGEGATPAGEYFIQKIKFDDVLGANISKMDVGQFLLDEALEPSYERKAVVVGSNPKDAHAAF